jgi:hypothetical protein
VWAISSRECCPAVMAAMTRSRKSCEYGFMSVSLSDRQRKVNRKLL